MFGIEQLIEFMGEKFGVAVESNEIGEETVLLYHEELDEKLISEDVLQILPNPVSFHIYIQCRIRVGYWNCLRSRNQ
jgi:hypothetical protein